MARTVKSDPIRNFKFRVLIQPNQTSALASFVGGEIQTGFSVVSGLTVQNEMIAYREGGMNTHPHKMIGQSDYGPVTFTKGVFADNDALYRWQTFMHSWAQGGPYEGQSTATDNDYRCDIVVEIYDHPIANSKYVLPNVDDSTVGSNHADAVKLSYKLHNCWPASYSLGDLNAGDSSILIQQLVVNHEGFEIVWSQAGSSGAGTTSAGTGGNSLISGNFS